jgi:hypothetical protein
MDINHLWQQFKPRISNRFELTEESKLLSCSSMVDASPALVLQYLAVAVEPIQHWYCDVWVWQLSQSSTGTAMSGCGS